MAILHTFNLIKEGEMEDRGLVKQLGRGSQAARMREIKVGNSVLGSLGRNLDMIVMRHQ